MATKQVTAQPEVALVAVVAVVAVTAHMTHMYQTQVAVAQVIVDILFLVTPLPPFHLLQPLELLR
jgi:hypothetical protein